jgi:hypothetical protein
MPTIEEAAITAQATIVAILFVIFIVISSLSDCEEKTVLSNLMYFYSAFEVCVKKFISYCIWISPRFLCLFEIQKPELSLYNQYNHHLSDTMCHRDTL